MILTYFRLRARLDSLEEFSHKVSEQLNEANVDLNAIRLDNIRLIEERDKLIRDKQELDQQLRFYTDKSNKLETALDEARRDAAESRQENINNLKRMMNQILIATGSKKVPFEDVGPTPPDRSVMITQNDKDKQPSPRQVRRNFMAEFLQSEVNGPRAVQEYPAEPTDEEIAIQLALKAKQAAENEAVNT